MIKRFIFLLLCAGFISNSLSAQSLLTPELMWKMGRVSDPRVSPDGKTVLYGVRTYDLAANKGTSHLYSMKLSSNQTTMIADESFARWRPDGKAILYIGADKDGNGQIFSMDVDGKNKVQLSATSGDISNFGLSASGNMLWFTMDVKIDKTTAELYPDLPLATGKIIDNLMYRHWNQWEDESYSHVFYVKFEGGKIVGQPKDIMPNERFDCPMKPDAGDENIMLSPDGKWLAYTCKKLFGTEYATSTNSDIYLYDILKGKTTNITKNMNGYDVNPVFSPDGTKLVWQSMEQAGYEADRNRLFIYDFKLKTKTELSAGFDYNIETVAWLPGLSQKLYFIAGIQATSQVFCLDLKTKKPLVQVTQDLADHTGLALGMNGSIPVIITTRMDISHPTELFKIDETKKTSTQITFTNKEIFDALKLGKVESRKIKATDGKDILTWVIYPPDFDPAKKYPTLLYCQGGPQSTVSQFWSYRWNFQLMAANGYIVVAPNRRGLPSFGQDWNAQISGDWGGQCMNDYISAIDEVSKEPYVNKDKLGCVGASFGGYSVYWLAGHNETKRFHAFISHCGVFNLESMMGTTEELWFTDHDLGGRYFDQPTPPSYTKFSPSDFVKNWNEPILVIHNEKDFRVPLGQGMEAFTAAQLQKIPSRFLYFPDEFHWVTKPQNSVLWQRVFYEWLDKWLK